MINMILKVHNCRNIIHCKNKILFIYGRTTFLLHKMTSAMQVSKQAENRCCTCNRNLWTKRWNSYLGKCKCFKATAFHQFPFAVQESHYALFITTWEINLLFILQPYCWDFSQAYCWLCGTRECDQGCQKHEDMSKVTECFMIKVFFLFSGRMILLERVVLWISVARDSSQYPLQLRQCPGITEKQSALSDVL